MQLEPGVVDGLLCSQALGGVPLQEPLQQVQPFRRHLQERTKVEGDVFHGHCPHDVIQRARSTLIHTLPACDVCVNITNMLIWDTSTCITSSAKLQCMALM